MSGDIKNKLSAEELKELRQQLLDDIRPQLAEEFKNEELKQREEIARKKEIEQTARKDYVARMKESPRPWVDIIGSVETENGVKIELDWNDAFADHLKSNGITGANDEQIVQKWVTLLLRDMADDIDGTKTDKSEFV